jgi:hypothetical protein
MSLYNAFVVPVFSHGAQVWGPDFINVSFEGAMGNPIVQEQRAFMRSVVGGRKEPDHGLPLQGTGAEAASVPLG